jgi:ATP/maltotriose-dependent transcriptional regulator MalT
MTVPVVLVLDDVHLLRNTECRDALSVLADHVPPGSRLVLAGRDHPPLRVSTWSRSSWRGSRRGTGSS